MSVKYNLNLSKQIQIQRQNLLAQRKIKITCIVPVYNEEHNIADFLITLHHKLDDITDQYDIIVIDDGSIDNSVLIIKELLQQYKCIKLIKFSRNFGKEMALTAGLEHCQADVAILIDSDFQHPISLLSIFLDKWSCGYDMVYGIRQNREQESFIKRNLTNIFYRCMKLITNLNIVANAGDFRLLDKSIIGSLNQCQERGRFMKGLYAWVGYNAIGIPFTVSPRLKGKSSWKFSSLMDLALTGIIAFSNAPLRIWSFIGLFISLCSFAYAAYIIITTLLYGIDLPGYASIMVAIFFFGGIQLFSIGVLGEYIAGIFNEVKNRPKYIIDEKIGL